MIKNIPFDPSEYQNKNTDLKNLNNIELYAHYLNYGIKEGRLCHKISSRELFCKKINLKNNCLEIGPFANPLIAGENVFYCDVLSQDALRKRASLFDINIKKIPFIDFVLKDGNLDLIEMQFDSIISSHVIEHQPNLVKHLEQIQNRLKLNGKYYCLIPDKRYCFDRVIAESTIADILLAYEDGRRSHSIKSVIEHRALTVHNDAKLHWEMKDINHNIAEKKVLDAINEYKLSNGEYIDVHAWYFTPQSFFNNINLLRNMGYINLKIDEIYPTLKGNNEFWVVLK
jgi:SAM-dependent methyltransferase